MNYAQLGGCTAVAELSEQFKRRKTGVSLNTEMIGTPTLKAEDFWRLYRIVEEMINGDIEADSNCDN
jgi:signal transduction histidine kinase